MQLSFLKSHPFIYLDQGTQYWLIFFYKYQYFFPSKQAICKFNARYVTFITYKNKSPGKKNVREQRLIISAGP